MKHYDAIVVGGGPAGITAALYLCRSGISVAQIEMLAPGGQILKTESIENYPGFPKGIKGWEMADAFAAHLDDYELDRYNDAVLKMEQVPGGWSFSVGKETIVGKAVVVCSGANPRPLGVPRETQLTGRGVSYCALCDGNFFRDQVVAVVGGGNSALEEALYLSRIASKLYLIHRREGFRAAKVYQDKIRAGLVALTQQALADYDQMREREGAKLRADVEEKLARIESLVTNVEAAAPETAAAYEARLRQKLEAVLAAADIDESRIIAEAAIYADHVAVDEETVRLRSHIAQLRQMLESGSPVGRKADFLIQEFNREANTIGSKCQNADIAKVVVDLKSEIEKIREQIQNIE